MFGNKTISLVFAIGASAWIYSKMYRSSGGNQVNSIIVAAGAGLVLFLTMLAILAAIF
jgi:hypothetical protein